MTARPTAAPACWPYLEHRTCEGVEADHVEAAVNSASTIGWLRREAARFPIHQAAPKTSDAPASLTKPGDAGSLEEWLA